MTPRRLALAGLLLLPGLARAAGAAAAPAGTPVMARLLPDAPPMQLRSQPQDDPERLVRIHVQRSGAAPGLVLLPSRYGGDTRLTVLPLGDRQVVMAEMDGVGGTGISQRLGVLIGIDREGQLRVIGIENLALQEAGTCESEAVLRATLSARPGGLALASDFQRRRGPCGFRWRGQPRRERWSETLVWDGAGPLAAAALPAGAGPVQRAAAAARRQVAGLLARPVTDLRPLALERTGLFDLASPRHG
ncbi:hypothetical protein [Roseomonas sp. 18066]|uniref:hypothetical protein n=1 Tax=Roseomonas sp. 18066 TaxID=2681412 RepID=UPI00135B3E4F|nr:hypothetical protein [Roseomonas sp. 18066]